MATWTEDALIRFWWSEVSHCELFDKYLAGNKMLIMTKGNF